MTDSTTKPEHEGPNWAKLIAIPNSACDYVLVKVPRQRYYCPGGPASVDEADLIACLTANPQLRAAVLEGLGECMRWSIAEERMAAVITKLRLAESELAAERARVRELKAQAQRDTGLLLNLLARIHGDGGHRVIAVGVEQACAEADLMVAKWRACDGCPCVCDGTCGCPCHDDEPGIDERRAALQSPKVLQKRGD